MPDTLASFETIERSVRAADVEAAHSELSRIAFALESRLIWSSRGFELLNGIINKMNEPGVAESANDKQYFLPRIDFVVHALCEQLGQMEKSHASLEEACDRLGALISGTKPAAFSNSAPDPMQAAWDTYR